MASVDDEQATPTLSLVWGSSAVEFPSSHSNTSFSPAMDPSVPSPDNAPLHEHTPWPDQQLPPVKPPSPAFLMQLFFIPLIIVTIIVMVWLMFSWLAHMGTKPEQLQPPTWKSSTKEAGRRH